MRGRTVPLGEERAEDRGEESVPMPVPFELLGGTSDSRLLGSLSEVFVRLVLQDGQNIW